MLRLIDGFGHYDFTNIYNKWNIIQSASVFATPSIQASGARSTGAKFMKWTTGGGLNNSGIGNYLYRQFLDNQATWTIGFGFKADLVGINGQLAILTLNDYLDTHLYLTFTQTTKLQIVQNSGISLGLGTILATGTTSLVTNTWYYIELKVTINNTTGSYQLKLNGVDEIALATNQNTRKTGSTSNYANRIQFGCIESAGLTVSTSPCFADVYICDGTGSVNNTFLGDCTVETLFPDGTGNYNTWTNQNGNSTNNFQSVDESTPSEADYVETTTSGNKQSFSFTDLSNTPASIFGIQHNIVAEKTDTGSKQIKALTRLSSTDYESSAQDLYDSYIAVAAIAETNPETSAAWTASSINSAEFGVSVG